MESEYANILVYGLTNFTLRSVRLVRTIFNETLNIYSGLYLLLGSPRRLISFVLNYGSRTCGWLRTIVFRGKCCWCPSLDTGNPTEISVSIKRRHLLNINWDIFNLLCTADVDACVSIQANVIHTGRNRHLRVSDLFVDFNVGNADVQLDDLFNGDTELGEAMNHFLNENWRSVAAEMRPALEDAIGRILHGMTDRFFEAYTMDQLFPEWPHIYSWESIIKIPFNMILVCFIWVSHIRIIKESCLLLK